ncbi:MAG: translation elongation factor Ts [Flavobacteriales bacterium]
MAITAAEVNKLRQMTGAGMMDCKKALTESNGDFDAAIDILRKKGQKVAANRADRDAAEGIVLAKTCSDAKYGVLVSVNCETDFVAKNADFAAMAEKITEIALQHMTADAATLKGLPYANNLSVAEKLTEQTGVIGEKIDVNYCQALEAEFVFAYNHPGNRVASLVGLNKTGHEIVAKDVAMQVAAMGPIALDKSSTPQSVVDKELEIGKDLAIQEGKAPEMAEKIAQGRLNKFFKESTLLAQEFIKDNKMNVEQYVQKADKDLKVVGFKRHALGA